MFHVIAVIMINGVEDLLNSVAGIIVRISVEGKCDRQSMFYSGLASVPPTFKHQNCPSQIICTLNSESYGTTLISNVLTVQSKGTIEKGRRFMLENFHMNHFYEH